MSVGEEVLRDRMREKKRRKEKSSGRCTVRVRYTSISITTFTIKIRDISSPTEEQLPMIFSGNESLSATL